MITIKDYLEKKAYGEKEHKAFIGVALPPKKVGKSFRRAAQQGTVRVDTGLTSPERNPFTFSRTHSAANIPKAQKGRMLYGLQQDAVKNLSKGSIALHSGDRKAAAKFLAASAASFGRGGHAGADIFAHTYRPLKQGYASPLRKLPNVVPLKGFVGSAQEHLVGDDPKKGTMSALKREAKQIARGKISSDGHMVDKIVGDSADKKSMKFNKRYGSAFIAKAERQVARELSIPLADAKKIVSNALQSELTPQSVERGLARSERRAVIGEVKHRIKSPIRRARQVKTVVRKLLRK